MIGLSQILLMAWRNKAALFSNLNISLLCFNWSWLLQSFGTLSIGKKYSSGHYKLGSYVKIPPTAKQCEMAYDIWHMCAFFPKLTSIGRIARYRNPIQEFGSVAQQFGWTWQSTSYFLPLCLVYTLITELCLDRTVEYHVVPRDAVPGELA